jgi:serine-type D-Ala-D-Ala carboxypeptidase/endopeptidase
VVDAQLSFETDAQGRTTALVLHQGGRDQRAPRSEGPNKVRLAPRVLGAYVGYYELAPGIVLAITEQQGGLYAQRSGQHALPIYAASEREFFLEIVDVKLRFEVDRKGKTLAVVLHQNGSDQRARRLD